MIESERRGVKRAQQFKNSSLRSKVTHSGEAAEGWGKCRAGEEKMDHSFMYSSCVFSPQTMECWCVLVPPLGAHIQSTLRGQMPSSPTARLHANLKACCCCFPMFFNFPYAWQIWNQKRLGNSTPRSRQQSTCEVNLIDGKKGRGR